MKALVTGAAGFIGSHLSEHLIHAGHTVVGIDAFTDYYPRERKEHNLARLRQTPGFTLVEAAIADADLPRLLEGVTHVFHLAAQAGVRKSWGRDFRVYTVNNVEATQILLEACVGRPLERLVYASSSSVYGDNVALPMTEDALPQPREVVLLALARVIVGEAIEADDRRALGRQPLRQRRSDEPGRAGDQGLHANSSRTRSGRRRGRPLGSSAACTV